MIKKLISYLLLTFNIHFISQEVKIEIYKKILDKKDLLSGLCYALNWSYRDYLMQLNSGLTIGENYRLATKRVYNLKWLYFPEIYVSRPYKYVDVSYWWKLDDEGTKKRIKVLEKAIKLCS